MTERPILFGSPMVRAILVGRKTMTRRIMRPQPSGRFEDVTDGVANFIGDASCRNSLRCPYGAVGDRLWVRETWSTDAKTVYPCDPVIYRADVSLADDDPATAGHVSDCKGNQADCFACLRDRHGFRWRPSIHMFRKDSRITLEVTEIRIERLQAITEEDARAEGVTVETSDPGWKVLQKSGRCYDCFQEPDASDPEIHAYVKNEPYHWQTARNAFTSLWNSINGKRANWASNPWVWVVGFRRVQP